jgi:hypothetical protein
VAVFAIIWSLWLCTNDVIFNVKIALLYRSSTGVVLYSVHAHLFSI